MTSRILTALILCAGILVWSAAKPANVETFFATSGSYDLGWAGGTLNLRLGSSEVMVKFGGKPWPIQTLETLTVATEDWNVNASSYVGQLFSPFGNRILLYAPQPDTAGRLRGVTVGIPYREKTSDGQDAVCMQLDLIVQNGRIVDSRRFEVPDFRCAW